MFDKLFVYFQKAIYGHDKESERFIRRIEGARSPEDLDRILDDTNEEILRRNNGLIEQAYEYFYMM